MSYATTLLGLPERATRVCAESSHQRNIVTQALAWIVLGGVVFGAVVGSERGGAQVVIAAVKIPAATLVALAISGPALWAIARSFGRSWSFPTALTLLLSAGARSSLVLLACAPALWLVIDLDASYALTRLVAAAAYGLAGLSGVALLSRALGASAGRAPALVIGGLVFVVVAAQSAWILRPYIGDPRDPRVPLFAHGRIEGGVLRVLHDDLGRQ